MKHPSAFRRIFYLSTLVCLLFTLFTPYGTARAEDDAPVNSLWIPFADSGKEGNDGGNPPPPPPPPVETKAWARFTDTQWNTNSASLVTDANGGMHIAYHYYEAANDNAPTDGVYAYCARDCESAANWKSVTIGAMVNEIQLALTADGRPRILYRVSSEQNGQIFYYAECNANCTQASGWSGAAVAYNQGMAVLEMSDDEQPQRYFALDPQGRPRFVYGDYNSFRDPDHIGSFYAFCDEGCTAASNWSEVQINKDNGGVGPYRSEDFYYPVLAFTPSGQPRVLADGVTLNDESFLHYVACDSACEVAANWQSAPLWERGSGVNVSYDIEINAQGQPRVAYFDGARLGGEGEWLYYGWCDQACTTATNWQRYDFQFVSKEGQEPDLELDAEGKPHIAYAIYSQGGLAYSWCESACESANGQWTHKVLESRNDLATAWDVAYPPHCDGGIWDALTPTLSLDKAGNAVFGYDATYHARCWYNIETRQWEVFSQFHLVVRTTRTYFFPKP